VNGNLLNLYGLDCAQCFVPAAGHVFSTGLTYHVDPRKPPCQTQASLPLEVSRAHSTGSERTST